MAGTRLRSTRNESGQLPQFTGYGPALAKCRHGATACKRPLMRWKSSDRGDTLLDGGFLDRKENVGAGVRQSWVGQVPSFERVGTRTGCDARAEMHFTKCSLLIQDLLAAKRDLRLSKEIKRRGRYEGFIIADLGYLQ